MTDELIRKSDADAAIVACKGNGATRQACRDAIAALPAVTLKVKPLVWKRYGVEDWQASSPFGEYKCVRTLYDMSALWLGDKKLGTYGGGSHTEAQAAAQADYEARILAAMEPVAAPRRYMGQIMAECDCSRQGECHPAGAGSGGKGMTDDLVTRLRNQLEFWNSGGRFEAADRIERDAATIARLEGDLLASASLLATEHRIRQTAVDALDAAEAQVAALVKASMPFADIGVSQNPDHQPMIRMDRDAIIALRAAIAAAKGSNIDSEDRKGGE